MSGGAEPGGEYAYAPLPEHLTVPGWRVALIICTFSIALAGFLNSAQTGLAMGFWPSVLAAFCSGLVLCAGACLTGIVSVRTRLNTYLLVQRSFGLWGAALVNLVIALIHFCWFGVNVSFIGGAMVAADAAGYGIPGDFDTFVVGASIVMTASVIYGFRTLDRLAMIAVPMLGIVLIAVCVAVVRKAGIVLQPPASVAAPVMSFGVAVSALVGSNMLAVAAMPDLTRYVRTAKGAAISMVVSFPIATSLLMVVSALPALATGETDIMKLIVGFGFGLPGLLLLILSTWTLNAANLYSASLSMSATFPRIPQTVFTCVGGAIGMAFAVMGIIDSFIPFLLFLGIIIPPIAAIYVIDAFLVFRHADPAESIRDLPLVRWPAIATWIGSTAAALTADHFGMTLTTVPTLDATILGACAYLALHRFGSRPMAVSRAGGSATVEDRSVLPG